MNIGIFNFQFPLSHLCGSFRRLHPQFSQKVQQELYRSSQAMREVVSRRCFFSALLPTHKTWRAAPSLPHFCQKFLPFNSFLMSFSIFITMKFFIPFFSLNWFELNKSNSLFSKESYLMIKNQPIGWLEKTICS